MPNAETAEAFAQLVETRNKLHQMTKELNEAASKLQAKGGIAGSSEEGRRYIQLQANWDEAFRAFDAATDRFSATVKHLHEDLEFRRSTNGSGPNDTSK